MLTEVYRQICLPSLPCGHGNPVPCKACAAGRCNGSVSGRLQNEAALVEAVLQRLGADGDAVFSVEPAAPAGGAEGGRLLPHLNWPCTLRSALLVCRAPPPPYPTAPRGVWLLPSVRGLPYPSSGLQKLFK